MRTLGFKGLNKVLLGNTDARTQLSDQTDPAQNGKQYIIKPIRMFEYYRGPLAATQVTSTFAVACKCHMAKCCFLQTHHVPQIFVSTWRHSRHYLPRNHQGTSTVTCKLICDVIVLHSTDWLVFITTTECLPRGTDWIFTYNSSSQG